MALPIPGNVLESTREVCVTTVRLSSEKDLLVELAYQVRHDDGTIEPCWGMHLLSTSETQQLTEIPLNEWKSQPVQLGALQNNSGELYIGITKIQLGEKWIDPLKTTTFRLMA